MAQTEYGGYKTAADQCEPAGPGVSDPSNPAAHCAASAAAPATLPPPACAGVAETPLASTLFVALVRPLRLAKGRQEHQPWCSPAMRSYQSPQHCRVERQRV